LLSDSSALPGNISVAQKFFKIYKNSIKSRKYEEATNIKTVLTDLVENNIDTTAENMCLFGIKLQEDKLFLESILIFDAASTLSKKIKIPEYKLELIQCCVHGMTWTNAVMIEKDPDMKVVVKDYVLPLMHDKLHYMESTSSVSEQWKCLQVSWVLACIGCSQRLVDQLKEAEEKLGEGLKRMDEGFGENKIKRKIYGDLLNSLGDVCNDMSRYKEAASFYKQAISAKKAATGYDGDEEVRKLSIELREKKRDIERTENNLRRVQQKIK